jgi:orotate phosphoribosyltransferase-like protein
MRRRLVLVSPEEREEMRAMKARGVTYREIAEWIGVCRWTVGYYTKDVNIPPGLGRHGSPRVDRQKAMELFARGCSFGAISKELGVSKTTAYWAIHKRERKGVRP